MREFRASLLGLHGRFQFSWESPKAREQRIERTNVVYKGVYPSWHDARKNAGGYDAPNILAKAIDATRQVSRGHAACERDTVVFDTPQIAYPLLAWLLYVANRSSGHLRVLDFGGALGSSYYLNRDFLEPLAELRWGVVEQEHFVCAGKAEFQNDKLSFHTNIDECIAALDPNFVLLSGVLQYLERPYEFLSSLLSKGIPYMLIDRTTAKFDATDLITVQYVPPTIYDASYPVWFLGAGTLERCFHQGTYEIVDRFQSSSAFGFEDAMTPYRGWFLQKRGLRQ
jgi:putative methyltransferase (TIGR04325 family)